MASETWLLTGGAGYIGTHIADEFISNGKSVVIVDSLYQGLESRITFLRAKHGAPIPFIKCDIRDYNEIENAIREYKIDGIVHTAALKAVGESMEKPDEYFQVNLDATKELIEIAKRNGVKKFIFSSTAAVYGSPDSMEPCKEDGPKAPISPYGDSKYQAESSVTAFINEPGNHGTSLRFFNVVGTAAPELLDNSVENLVPIVLGKLNKGRSPSYLRY
jgi:UDP-glucose 4-epimerase